MKSISDKFQGMVANVPDDVKREVDLSFAIADRINCLMRERGLTKKQFADALGKNPSEVTKWLSGQHNFTIRTIALLSEFFGKPIIQVYAKLTPVGFAAEDVAAYNAPQTHNTPK